MTGATPMDFQVSDMTCQGCVNAITAAVRAVDPAGQVQADVPARQVRIASTLPRAAIAGAMRDAGFTPA